MHPIIKYFRQHKNKTLHGSTESYEILELIDDQYIDHGGSTFPFQEEFRHKITEEEVINKLKEYFKYKSEIFDIIYPDKESEWEKYLNENWYL